MSESKILESYSAHVEALEVLRESLEQQLRSLLAHSGIRVHSVSGRLKTIDSLANKLRRPDKTYRHLWDVTDLVGLRIITFFEDSIDEVASLVERNFAVDYNHSVNKLQLGQHDRFGYRSLHYVCRDVSNSEVRFEIQIRTILQHAWAEIEHDLGYKAGELAPAAIRRRFSRIASLLEIADQEFVSIRTDLDRYVKTVGADSLTGLDLDIISLASLTELPSVKALDEAIARLLDKRVGDEVFYPDYLIRVLRFAGFRDTKGLIQTVDTKLTEITALIAPYFEFLEAVLRFNPASMTNIPKGYGLLVLAHWCLLESEALDINKTRRIAEFYQSVDEPLAGVTPIEVATRFLSIVRRHDTASLV